jgi:predicted nucleotidyltransferase
VNAQNSQNPNLAKVELVAHVLGPLRDQLVFVGGCAAGLLLTDQSAAPARVTYDVDLTVQVAALPDFYLLEEQFTGLGFKRDVTMEVICRWQYQGLEVDLMPSDPAILGFANRWYPLAIETAQTVTLPSGKTIRLITAPAFLATKFEAFADRGKGDLLGSHDLEDIINVLDGRPELPREAAAAPAELRAYLGARCRELLATPNFMDFLPGMVFPDESLAERVLVLAQRLQQIAELE